MTTHRSIRTALVLAVLLLAPAVRADDELRIQGSITLGEELGPALAKAYMKGHPGARVEWAALGSSAGIGALLDGSAQLGASARPVRDDELAEAQRLGVALSEHVIGYDGIAVVVHPSNRVASLSLQDLAQVFSGRTASWSSLGGAKRQIEPVSLPAYSGTHEQFRDRVLRRDDGGRRAFSVRTRFFETNRDVVAFVARHPGAIGYVSLGFAGGPKVRAIAVEEPQGATPGPGAERSREGSDPFQRVLYVYSAGEPHGVARDFLRFVQSAEGQALVASHHLIPIDLVPAGTADRAGAADGESDAEASVPPLTRILFGPMSTALGRSDRSALDRLVALLRQGDKHALITGHSDGMAPLQLNAVYARDRAEAVARYLRGKGVPARNLEIADLAETRPVASNASERGRKQNRRVDLRLIDAPAGGGHE